TQRVLAERRAVLGVLRDRAVYAAFHDAVLAGAVDGAGELHPTVLLLVERGAQERIGELRIDVVQRGDGPAAELEGGRELLFERVEADHGAIGERRELTVEGQREQDQERIQAARTVVRRQEVGTQHRRELAVLAAIEVEVTVAVAG